MQITIPKNMDRWKQIGGDVIPGAHGGIIARTDGEAIEIREIQPVREFVGDGEAREVGFPFWSREAYFDSSDLSLDSDEVQSALESIGMSDEQLEQEKPEVRALIIAEALLRYGSSEEGPGGWAEDVVPDEVEWWTGKVAGPEYFADEDEDFIREVLLSGLDIDYESFGPDENAPTGGLRVANTRYGGDIEIIEWTDIEHATGEEIDDDYKVSKVETQASVDELFEDGAKHRGTYAGDDPKVGFKELAQMSDEDREAAVVAAAIAYIGYYGGTEEHVENVGD